MMKKKKKLKKSRVADYLSPETNPRYNTELDASRDNILEEDADFDTEQDVLTDQSEELKLDPTEYWEGQ